MTGTVAEVHEVVAVRPKVRLVAYTHEPFALAVASARTCYAKDFVFVNQLTPTGERHRTTLLEAFPDQAEALARIGDPKTPQEMRIGLVDSVRDSTMDPAAQDALVVFADLARQRASVDERIAASIYEAGHHTPFQHPTFVFSIEDASRNVVESFLHQHIFFNSEQQSQRYVEMARAEVVVPDSIAGDPERRAVFDAATAKAWGAYHDLRGRLTALNERVMTGIGRVKGLDDTGIRKEAEKKAQEMARYVVPIAAATRLYHTVSGIVLLRYIRMAKAQNAHEEADGIVQQMVAAVKEADPDFFAKLQETAHDPEDLVEWALVREDVPNRPRPDLGDLHSCLVHATPDAGILVADVVREVTGSELQTGDLLARILDPGQNRIWNDTLNTWDHSPVLRSLRHVHLTFHKRLSLTAYAQDQRHRMTPGTRPLLHRLVGPEPDVYTPDIIAGDADARAVYDDAVAGLWSAMLRLKAMGVPAEDVAYLLPNATNQYYTQSGDLLSWIHKWRLRLCFNAQKEIFEASLDELRQAQEAMPDLTRWLGPPCTFIAAAQPPEAQDSVDACCPEGPRWCGVKVWKGFDAASGKPRRPY